MNIQFIRDLWKCMQNVDESMQNVYERLKNVEKGMKNGHESIQDVWKWAKCVF